MHVGRNRMARLEQFMKEIAETGDLSRRADIGGRGAAGRLGLALDLMLSEFEKQLAQLKQYALNAAVAHKKERETRDIFQKYVPREARELIDGFIANPESALASETRVLSVSFSSIRDFTAICELMAPDELVVVLNRYFSVMGDIIYRYGGIVDKYIGDTIMAFWGVPKGDNDAKSSVLAGLDMVDGQKGFNEGQRKLGRREFNIGIGISYGVASVGNIGTEKKMEFTVIGDTVNLASQLMRLTMAYRQDLVISESVQRRVMHEMPTRLMDYVVLKGRARAVRIYAVKKSLEPREKQAWDLHNAAMEKYFGRNFHSAAAMFADVCRIVPGDYPSRLFMERCTTLEKNPPSAAWNGSVVVNTP
jgi:adenylate cyclase